MLCTLCGYNCTVCHEVSCEYFNYSSNNMVVYIACLLEYLGTPKKENVDPITIFKFLILFIHYQEFTYKKYIVIWTMFRIQALWWIRILDPDPDPSFNDRKVYILFENNSIFSYTNSNIFILTHLAFQATAEASSPPRRTSSSSNTKFFSLFSFSVGHRIKSGRTRHTATDNVVLLCFRGKRSVC